MKALILIITIALMGCGGSMTPEQRESLKEEMHQREIKQLSAGEIFEKAYRIGQEIADSVVAGKEIGQYQASIEWLENKQEVKSKIEKEIWEAYQYALSQQEKPAGNLQKNENQDFIYSYPIIENDTLKKVLLIRLTGKQVVLSF